MDEKYFCDVKKWYRFIFTKTIFWIFLVVVSSYILTWVFTLINSFWFKFDISILSFQTTTENIVNKTLSDNDLELISAFVSAILAIAVPMSVGALSAIDKKYNVGKLTKSFYQESVLKSLILLLFANVLGILLTAAFSCNYTPLLYYFSWTISFVSILLFFLFVLLVKTYYSDLKHLINFKANGYKKDFLR